MARHAVMRKLHDWGAHAVWRKGMVTDNGHDILDVTGLNLLDPQHMEKQLDCIPGVVECGIFALRRADRLIVGTPHGVDVLDAPELL